MCVFNKTNSKSHQEKFQNRFIKKIKLGSFIFNLEFKKQINEIKNFAKFTDILIDENLGYNNFYIE